MVRVLVTGAAGGIGRVVVDELVRRGRHVVAVDRHDTGLASTAAVTRVVADVTDPTAMGTAAQGCDELVHLAAIPHPDAARPVEVFHTNTVGTFVALQAAVEAGVRRAVLASSVSALGMAWSATPLEPQYVPIDEDHPLRPAEEYGLSKLVVEEIAAMFHRRHGIAATVLRFPWVALGPGPLRDRVREVAEDPGAGAATRDLWSYVLAEDLARACAASLGTTGLGFDVLTITAPDTLSELPTEELLHRFFPAVGVRRPIPGTAAAWTTGRAQRLIGFSPAGTWRRSRPADPTEPADPTGDNGDHPTEESP